MYDVRHGAHPVELLLYDESLEDPFFWARQYACRVACELGSTALVLMEDEERTIEVYGSSSAIPDIPIFCSQDVTWMFAWLASFSARTIVVPSRRDENLHVALWGIPIRLMTPTDAVAVAKTRAKTKWLAHDCIDHDLDPPRLDLVLIEDITSRTLERVDQFIAAVRSLLGIEISIADRIKCGEVTANPCCLGCLIPAALASSDALSALGCHETASGPMPAG